MHKVKNTILLLLTALLLAAGAALPQIAAVVQDIPPEAGFAPLNSIRLDLRTDAVSMKERIAIWTNGEFGTEITETLTRKTEDEILDIAAQIISQYQNAGLITAPDIDVYRQKLNCTPMLTVFEGETQASVMYWHMQVLFDDEEQPLRLTIDDETGRLLSIDYYYSKENSYLPDETVLVLSSVYLDGLGEEFSEYAPDYIQDYQNPDDDPAATVVGQHWDFSWEQESYGVSGINFDAWEYGFSVHAY